MKDHKYGASVSWYACLLPSFHYNHIILLDDRSIMHVGVNNQELEMIRLTHDHKSSVLHIALSHHCKSMVTKLGVYQIVVLDYSAEYE